MAGQAPGGGGNPLRPPPAAMLRNNNGSAGGAAWMNQQMNMGHAMNMNQQQQPQQQQQQQVQGVPVQQQMGGINPMNMTAQQQQQLQQHRKLQMMQLHQRLKQQRGGATPNPPMQPQQQQPQQQQQWSAQHQGMQQNSNNLGVQQGNNNVMQHRNSMMQQQAQAQQQQQQQMGNAPIVGQQGQQQQLQQQQQQPQAAQSQQMMKFHLQQQQMKQLQQMQQSQPQQGQQMMQQQQPQQQQMMQQQQQALEEQKRRYSQQLQQLQNQQNLQHAQQGQLNRPGSTSSHQSHQSLQQPQLVQPQQNHPMSRSTSISSQQQTNRRPSYRMGAGTPLSPAMRPGSRPGSTQPMRPGSTQPLMRPGSTQPLMRPGSTQPIRPPSRPSSQFSQGSAASSHSNVPSNLFPGGQQQSNSDQLNNNNNNIINSNNNQVGDDFPSFTYNPVSTAKSNKSSMARSRSGGDSTRASPAGQQHVAFDTSTFSSSNTASNTNADTKPASATTPDGTPSLSNQEPAAAASSASSGKSAGKGGKKTAPQRRHSQVQHSSSLTYEEVSNLAKSCTAEQKIVWIARQTLGAGGTNGFQKATATMQRMKKQRARSFKAKEGMSAKDTPDDGEEKLNSEEKLKKDTFNIRLAKRMQAEMTSGLQFVNLMQDVIRSVLEEIDPDNPVLLVQPPPIGIDGATIPDSDLILSMAPSLPPSVDSGAVSSGSAASGPPKIFSESKNKLLKPPKASSSSTLDSAKDSTKSSTKSKITPKVPMSPSAARKASMGSDSGKEEGNPSSSTLRKLRKRGSGAMPVADLELIKMVGQNDENGKKFTKKELAYRLFEGTRFRTLEVGDYVAAKMASHEVWILGRVSKKWNSVGNYQQLRGLTVPKRDALFREKVYIQDNDEFTGNTDDARAILRQHVLPLPRSFGEASDWCTRIRKGSRVYAMYPNTTALYSASVIDSTTYCRKQDDIVVVQFDGDEDDDGEVPHRHIPARFVTLIPREFPASKNRKRKSTTATSAGGAKRRASATNKVKESSKKQRESSVDEMLLGMMGDTGNDSLGGSLGDIDFDDMNFSSTPRSTPPPLGGQPQPEKKKRSRAASKKQKGDELASSHFAAV